MAGKKVKSSKSMDSKELEKDQDEVTFDVWFHRQQKAGNLQSWQKREVSVFFKQKGLSDSEEADKYSELLKLY